MNKLALFDCDGTLVDSQANICLCMERTFDRASIARPSRAAIRRLVGLSLAEVIAELVPKASDDVQRALVDGYRAMFAELRTSGAMDSEPLFDGIADTLTQLLSEGWQLGVATGKSDRGLIRVLTDHGLIDQFITLQTADRHPSKPHPSMVHQAMTEAGASPETTIVIGDTSFDMMMARSARARALGVNWGYHQRHELEAAGAFAIASHPRDIFGLMEAK